MRISDWRSDVCSSDLIELTIRAGGRYLPPDAAIPAWIPWAEIERIARAAYTWTALLATFGWAQVLLDRRFRWLPYCTSSVERRVGKGCVSTCLTRWFS